MITIYHNPRCRKSRAGLQYLQDKGIEPEIVEYLKNPLSKEEIKELLKKLGKSPLEMIRTQEEVYRNIYKGKDLSDSEWIEALAEYPKLLQRPIVAEGNKAVLGDPAENIEEIL
jgi:arsenate reductase (glutaredoxin)